MNYGFFRTAAASPETVVADCTTNANRIIDACKKAGAQGASLIVFPELAVTSYSCGDLFLQTTLQEAAIRETERIAKKTASLPILIAVGLPFASGRSLYNCAAFIFAGKILALVPKTYLPNSGEYSERRWFSPKKNAEPETVYFSKAYPAVPFGCDIIISDADDERCAIALEIGEDLRAPVPPSSYHALSGAAIIANLSASSETVGKAEYRRLLVKSQSARTLCAYVYADAGHGESTQDAVFASHKIIAENGEIIAESKSFDDTICFADIDIERLASERRRETTFSDCAANANTRPYRKVSVDLLSRAKTFFEKAPLFRTIDASPFVPNDESGQSERWNDILTVQAEGLAKRMRHTGAKNAVIGLSGGLDSTLALLVTVRAFGLCGLNASGIRAVTMPCFGTSDRTYRNACALAKETGVTLSEINIAEAVRVHFRDIGQDESLRDAAYENAQARERTQVLMDIANKINGIVVGTGDLSELALGWCTYNGDHMSMYGVNGSVPKTLVRRLVRFCADSTDNKNLSSVLNDILATPVSPELLPSERGKVSQKTEDILGPYELHDFFLYYMLRFGFSPAKILFLADKACLPYTHEEKLRTLRIFYKRFFSQQFKRSCMPDGAKVGSISLSPRSDWRMPSDASAALWLTEIDSLK